MSQGGLDFRKARMLVVGESTKALDVLCTTLRGFRVREIQQSESTADAKRFAGSGQFDLILADCEMPEEDGIAFAQWLRSDPDGPNFTAPLILLSAFTAQERVCAARDAGANMVVAKPVVPAVLLSRIEWVARNHRRFVICESYRGPDRRFKAGLPPEGVEERRADLLALAADGERDLSQNDIDSLFG